MSETLSQRFVKSYNELDSHLSALDFMAWQRWLYREKLKNAGVELKPQSKSPEPEDMPGHSSAEQVLYIFEDLPDERKLNVLDYISWLKMVDDKQDADDIAYCLENQEEFDNDEGISLEEFQKAYGF